MQRGHCDDSQRAFPPTSCNADIAPPEATPPPDPGRKSSMPRTGAVSSGTPTAPSAEAVGRVAPISGRRIVGAGLTGSKLRPKFIQRRSEMKALWCGATALAFVATVSPRLRWPKGQKPTGGNAEECGSGRLWVSLGYASRGKWRPAHCASDTQVLEETGPKSSYGDTKTFNGPPPSGVNGESRAPPRQTPITSGGPYTTTTQNGGVTGS